MKKHPKPLFYLLLMCFLGCFTYSFGQLTPNSKKRIVANEDSIKLFATDMIDATDWEMRFMANDKFTKGLVAALKEPFSFYYPFDSLQTVSIIYPPDSSFRVFSWQVVKDYTFCLQKGAIQMKTTDGSLKLYPLYDVSSFTEAPNDSVRSPKDWIGAIYYKVLQTEFNAKKYYTFLGYDDNNERSNKKWVEVLTFNQQNEPVFGGRFFQYANDPIKPPQPAFRFNLEYKKDARVRLNYDDDTKMIVFDHLIAEDGDEENKASLIPDGTYEGFKWANGMWVHVPVIAYQKVNMTGVDPLLGNAPVENPLLDDDGKPNQAKLDEQNKKNMQKETPPETSKKAPKKKSTSKDKKN